MKVIYIISSAHSGSTVLGSILGNLKNSYHGGEFTNLYHVYSGKLETCSCRELPSQCPFWSKIVADFINYLKSLNSTIKDYEDIRVQVESSLHHKIDKKKINYYKNATEELFRIIGRQSEKKIIIDSSKSSWRALALFKTFGNDLSVVYIRRNLFDVIKSFEKKRGKFNIKPFLKGSLKEHFKYIYILRKINSTKINLNYDDIFKQDKMNNITSTLGYPNNISITDELNNYHVIAGNRMRYQNKFHLKRQVKTTYSNSLINRILIQLTDLIRQYLRF